MIDPAAVAARLWPSSHPLVVETSAAGGNNRLFRISDGRISRALKFYPSADGVLRLSRERAALAWLSADLALARTPAFHAADDAAPAALIDWIEGAPVGEPQTRDIDAVVAFTNRLLSRRHEARALGLAAEATPAATDLEAQIELRLARTRRRETEAIAADIAAAYRAFGPVATAPAATLIPSPSDFGFHNALRLPGGDLAFIDFEYFGRDDPVRLAADFILHPGMWRAGSDPWSCPMRARFRSVVEPTLEAVDSLYPSRLRRQLPYIALRWALIVLNPLSPERTAPTAEVAQRQLAKAEALLAFARNFR